MVPRRLSVFAAGAIGLFAARSACAAPIRVALLQRGPSSAALSLALTRLEGELVADGFEVFVAKSIAARSNEASDDEPRSAASIAVGVDPETHTAELTVVDRMTHKSSVRQFALDEPDPAKAAEYLAVRAVELLRASLLELLIQSSLSATRPPSVDPNASRRATMWARGALRPEDPPDWAAEVGAAVHWSPNESIGPAVVGLLRVSRILGRSFALRACFGGAGTQPRVTTREGTATVTVELGLLEIVATPWAAAVVRPTFSLGAGALLTTVDGQGLAPYVGRKDSQLSFATDAGLGIAVRLSQRFGLAIEAHALLARPYPSVRFLGVEVARADAPGFFGNVTVVSFL